MSILKNKIDFVAIISCEMANPNGDPLNDNRPRTDYDGYGEISDVCMKRKMRNRMQDMGIPIFVQSAGRETDEFRTLAARSKALIKDIKDQRTANGADVCAKMACEKWMDVRSFGHVFTYDNSYGVRGPVNIHQASSIDPVDIVDYQITKSCNGDEPAKGATKSSDTMGHKQFVRYGLYKMKGSINVQLAEKTGFTEEDAETIKQCILTMFENDASAARPDGSMEIVKLYWFKHNSKTGQYPAATVHRSVTAKLKDQMKQPKSVSDYDISIEPLPGLEYEEFSSI